MRCKTFLCLKSLGVCSTLFFTGCGTSTSPTLLSPETIPAPRTIELPANIRPLLQAETTEQSGDEGGSVPAQYQQPQTPASSQPRITGLSAASQSSAPPSVGYSGSQPAAMPSAAPPNNTGSALGSPNGGMQSSIATQQQENVFVPVAERTNQFAATQSAHQPPPVQWRAPTPTQQTAAMQAIAQQAMQMANQAAAMAQRGMLYSARTELTKSLTLITQALDVQERTAIHSTSLVAGLTALDEARDFASAGSQASGSTNIAAIAATHQTKLPAGIQPGTSPVVAQQQYFAYAQNQLAIAAGGVPTASEILYRLGRLQTALAAHDSDPMTLHVPQAMVFHQAALATDGNNWLAANELGVLYARYGQLPESRQLFVQSVTMHPHRQGWQNLAVIHRRLGEIDLAQRAEAEVQLIDKQPGQSATANDIVRWVDPKTFAASSGGDANWPVTLAAKPTANSGTTRR